MSSRGAPSAASQQRNPVSPALPSRFTVHAGGSEDMRGWSALLDARLSEEAMQVKLQITGVLDWKHGYDS